MNNTELFQKFHGIDLRKGRVSIPEQIYFVTAVTKDRYPCFQDFYAGRLLVNTFQYHHQKFNVESLAFVVMPDHFHWLFSLGRHSSLSKIISSVKRTSSRNINRVNQQVGTIWQKGFHDHALRNEEDIQDIARYIVANPLRAGLVERVGDYPLWDAKWL